ncbi:MAG TPA: hypothetical protein VFP84_04225 [Kofleriaceae bacterium]|nr:hypothetical protein [Kofleriaceae bacterium]
MTMGARIDVMLWAQRVVGRKNATAVQILELPADATAEAAQDAFHKIARMAHPDLHRNGLTPEELELVTTAYARAAAAYHELRGRPITAPPPRSPTAPPPRGRGDSAGAPVSGPTSDGAANAMTSKALIYYRKAELSLRRGDLPGAVLQLKMAIATDPASVFLRSALAEVQAEIGKK